MKDPCISVCKFSDNICLGCGRSKAEIKAWKKLDNGEQRLVMAEADMRLLVLGSRARSKR